MVGWLTGWQACLRTDWLDGWLVGCLVELLVGRLGRWMTSCWVRRLFVGRSDSRLVVWLVGLVVDWSAGSCCWLAVLAGRLVG